MTRLEAGILAQLTRGPYTVLDLALALNETTQKIRKALEGLDNAGIVERTDDVWKLTPKVAA